MTITEYLLALLAELRLPGRARRRILAEVEDHLLCAGAELHSAGLDADVAEREAVRRFGAPRELAESFIAAHAARSGVRLAHATVILAALVAWMSAPARTPTATFPLALLWFVLAQVVVVASGLTWLRAVAARRAGMLPNAGLALVLRGTRVVLGGAGAAGLIVLSRATSGGAGVRAGEVAGMLAMAALGIAVAVSCGRCRRLLSGEDSDQAAPAARHERVGLSTPDEADFVLLAADRVASWLRGRVPPLARWLNLRAHPWRFALAVAATAGVGLAAVHGLSEGAPSAGHLIGGLIAAAIIAAIEAAATLLGFAALGPVLGLRGANPRPAGARASGPLR